MKISIQDCHYLAFKMFSDKEFRGQIGGIFDLTKEEIEDTHLDIIKSVRSCHMSYSNSMGTVIYRLNKKLGD